MICAADKKQTGLSVQIDNALTPGPSPKGRGDVHLNKKTAPAFTATRNACKLCAPLGACLAFRGVEGAVPLLHGSQGCSTYIRRYLISHFKEPLDIASSNFSEATAIFGGKENLQIALKNVIRQYNPPVIGIATTCLAETIGDDVGHYLRQIREETPDCKLPEIINVSTPSYVGTHAEGFSAAVRAIVDSLAQAGPRHESINILPGIVSPADIRYLKDIFAAFGLKAILLPDYSDTLDGPAWSEYQQIPPGGTPVESIRLMGSAKATIEFGPAKNSVQTAGMLLEERFGVPLYIVSPPIGVIQTDQIYDVLEELSGRKTPESHREERGRLVDAYVDAHKYVFGKRAVIYGDEDLVVGMASLLAEIGMIPVLCASGAETGRLAQRVAEVAPDLTSEITVLEGADFAEIEDRAAELAPDIMIGNSKGYRLSHKLGIPLIRVGLPIHDRIDGPRILHVGYRGAQQLFDRIANALIEKTQDSSPVGYSYM
jgi:nitrogenase molybdenum-iron protein NifN